VAAISLLNAKLYRFTHKGTHQIMTSGEHLHHAEGMLLYFGLHSRASLCASAISSGVILLATRSRFLMAAFLMASLGLRASDAVEANFKSRRFFMPGMSIGEVARKMGLRSSAIRYYEKLGLIPKATRLSGRRRYDERVLERLAMVRLTKHVGFSIAEIKVLLRGVDSRPPPARWRKLAAEKVAQVDAFVVQARTIRKLLSETLDFQCPKLVERGRALPSEIARPALRLKPRTRSARSD
jgi:MerR family redox-sensitive transcriptional activator SoxR